MMLEKELRRLVEKMAICFALCFIISSVLLHEPLARIDAMLTLNYILGQNHAAPWAVLVLCGIWLWLKRTDIVQGMKEESYSPVSIVSGLILLIVSLLIPAIDDLLVFQLLLAWLAVFIIFFGKGMLIPAIMLVIYGFSISFPLLINRFAELPYSQTIILPAMRILTMLSYPLECQRQWITFVCSTGEQIDIIVNANCAGPATMGLFIALFALMMLDRPLPAIKACCVFLFGIVGTWIQSLVRLIILLLVGYYYGEAALWTAHFWTIYLLFPLWYLIFLYVYFYVYNNEIRRTPS